MITALTYITHSRKINSALITSKILSTATIHPIAFNEKKHGAKAILMVAGENILTRTSSTAIKLHSI